MSPGDYRKILALIKEWDKAHPHIGVCSRCQHEWYRRMKAIPVACPRCHSTVFFKKKRKGTWVNKRE